MHTYVHSHFVSAHRGTQTSFTTSFLSLLTQLLCYNRTLVILHSNVTCGFFFYLVSLMASNLPSQPWNLSETFISYLNMQFRLPIVVNPQGSSSIIHFCQRRSCQLLEAQPHHWFWSWRSFCIKMRVNQLSDNTSTITTSVHLIEVFLKIRTIMLFLIMLLIIKIFIVMYVFRVIYDRWFQWTLNCTTTFALHKCLFHHPFE